MSRNSATATSPAGSPHRARLGVAFYATVLLIVATVGQLAVATFVSGLPQFEGKAFGSRLLFYPLLMTAPIAVWWLATRRRAGVRELPWAGFACVSAPFFIDVTGNTLDLYDTIALGSRGHPDRHRRHPRDRLGDRRVVHVHPSRHRTRNRLHRHAQ